VPKAESQLAVTRDSSVCGRMSKWLKKNYEFRRLRAIFDGDGSEIREQFILAGLLLTIFERFKKYVVDLPDGYFSHHIEIRDGDLKYTRGEEFKKIIKEKGIGAPGQHANKEFRAALHWFCDLGAITEDEFNDVERIYTLRNDIGHKLFHIIADDNKNSIKRGWLRQALTVKRYAPRLTYAFTALCGGTAVGWVRAGWVSVITGWPCLG
jgi:hypothetical protein